MNDLNSLQANECYRNSIEHRKCLTCNIDIGQYKYKKGSTVCKLCYNNQVLAYYKNKLCLNPSPESDAGTQTDISFESTG